MTNTPSPRVRLLTWLALAAALALVGCGRSEPRPADVYRQFHGALVSMARGGETGAAEAAYGLLTKASQDKLVALSDAANDALPASVARRKPHEFLRVRRLKAGGPIDEIVEKSADPTKTVLEVRIGEVVETVAMVREADAWRVALFEGPEAGAKAVESPGGTL